MNNKNLPATPVPITEGNSTGEHYGGLTKREYFAAMALQGLLSNPVKYQGYSSDSEMAAQAIWLADTLLTELEK